MGRTAGGNNVDMGFFRFRRSIKILPGVRWNFGKRSSSISLGGRGFHYTIGTHGTRTTVGLPGTGLSYTTTSATRRRGAPSPIHMDKALEWVSRQEGIFRIEVPDREEGEAPATQKQIESIRDLVKGIQGVDFDALGKKQASTLIDAIKAEKDRFTERKIQEYLTKQKRKHLVVWGVVLLFLLAWIYSNSNRAPAPSAFVAVPPAPRPVQPPATPLTADVAPAPAPSVTPLVAPQVAPSATPPASLAPAQRPARKVTLKTVKTIYPDSGGTRKVDPGTVLNVIAVAGGVMTVELNGQTFNVSKSEIIQQP